MTHVFSAIFNDTESCMMQKILYRSAVKAVNQAFCETYWPAVCQAGSNMISTLLSSTTADFWAENIVVVISDIHNIKDQE